MIEITLSQLLVTLQAHVPPSPLPVTKYAILVDFEAATMSRGQSPAAQGIAGLSFRSEGAASTSSRSPRKPEDVSDADVKLASACAGSLLAFHIASEVGLQTELSLPMLLQFKTTLIARRFPGIRDMPQNEIKQLIAVDQNAARRVNQDPRLHRTHPKTNFEANLPPPKRSTLSRSQSPEKAPFSPINPESAKKTIARPHTEVESDVETLLCMPWVCSLQHSD
jgi:hypothetical protein